MWMSVISAATRTLLSRRGVSAFWETSYLMVTDSYSVQH